MAIAAVPPFPLVLENPQPMAIGAVPPFPLAIENPQPIAAVSTFPLAIENIQPIAVAVCHFYCLMFEKEDNNNITENP